MIDEVALAAIGAMPAIDRAPKVRNVPPPATALTTPESEAGDGEEQDVGKIHVRSVMARTAGGRGRESLYGRFRRGASPSRRQFVASRLAGGGAGKKFRLVPA